MLSPGSVDAPSPPRELLLYMWGSMSVEPPSWRFASNRKLLKALACEDRRREFELVDGE